MFLKLMKIESSMKPESSMKFGGIPEEEEELKKKKMLSVNVMQYFLLSC